MRKRYPTIAPLPCPVRGGGGGGGGGGGTIFLRGNCTRTMRKLANIIFWFNSTFLFLNLKQISKYISYLHLHLFEVLIRFISVLILGIARKCSSFSWRQEGPLFNRRYIYFLAFKRLVNNNFNYLIFLFKEII